MQHYNRIRDLREDKDLTQEQLIKLLGMHKTTYTNYEQGKHSVPLDFAVELAQFYKVSLDYIAGLTNEKDGLTKSSLDSTETEVVYKLRKLNDIDKGRILGMMDALIEKGK
ncbi:MAG: helix-turn-helix transcriptional regulator [Oscillospiraceae bacterium]|nr:helix-turn-helix transcriptional regulator [Oscillospiraceae bacterium]